MWHLAAFGGLAVLLARGFGYWGRAALPAARDAAVAAISLGGLLELLQSLTRYRSPDWADFAADALGAALAYLALRALNTAAAADRVTACGSSALVNQRAATRRHHRLSVLAREPTSQRLRALARAARPGSVALLLREHGGDGSNAWRWPRAARHRA